ncbi:MAG TPA: hypothetical protein VFO40_26880 [Chthoniobacterales bacterium]|nr:hypothetical protein [Chthoniobacterales bacterium]
MVYPPVGENVLGMAHWGVALVQWAKVLNSALGTELFPVVVIPNLSFFSHVVSSYAITGGGIDWNRVAIWEPGVPSAQGRWKKS